MTFDTTWDISSTELQKRHESMGIDAGRVVYFNGKIKEFPTIFLLFCNDIESKLKMSTKERETMRKEKVQKEQRDMYQRSKARL